jgi:hypothetical protein
VEGIRRVWVGLGRAEEKGGSVDSARNFQPLRLWDGIVFCVVCLRSRLKLTAGSIILVCGVLMLFFCKSDLGLEAVDAYRAETFMQNDDGHRTCAHNGMTE